MNGLDLIIKELLVKNTKNTLLLEKIAEKTQSLLIEEIFEITKIFVARNAPIKFESFTLKTFQDNDPDGYFQKILKGFANALIDISETDLSKGEEERINYILDNVKIYDKNS